MQSPLFVPEWINLFKIIMWQVCLGQQSALIKAAFHSRADLPAKYGKSEFKMTQILTKWVSVEDN